MFGLFRRREHPERRFVREEFENMMTSLRAADRLKQAAVGHVINLANSIFLHKFGSIAKFNALPASEKMAYVAALTKMEELAAKKDQLDQCIGHALYKKWIGAMALRDEKLAQQFSKELAELSRMSDLIFGPPNPEPLSARYDEMTEEQRILSARFIREHKERELRAAAPPPVPAVHGPLEERQRAYKRGDYSTALDLLRPLADKGDAAAQFNLGVIYAEGQDRKDYDRAVAMYRAAAEKGIHLHLKAQYRGVCMQPDFVLAHKWFNLAASNFTEAAKRTIALQSLAQIASEMTRAQIAEAETRAREWKASR